MRYAWDWFHYHADQRLRAFHFFLILTSAVVVGYASAAADDSAVLGSAVGLLGAAMALAFLFLDLRNVELVGYARSALTKLEPRLESIDFMDSNRNRKLVISHSFWLRAMLILVGLSSILATGWAMAGFPD